MNIVSYVIKKINGLFYGWYIVAGLATVSMVSVGIGGMNLGLFVQPMNHDLGISFEIFGWTQTARLIGFSMSSWLIGRIIDRHGARIPMAVAALLMGLIMAALSIVQTGWQLLVLIFLTGMIGLQGGGGNLYQSVPISRWFIKKRGKAMAISFLGTTVGLFIFTPLIQYMITYVNWRLAWLVIGCGSCIMIFVIAVAVVRKDPYSMGLYPDGEIPDTENRIVDEGEEVNHNVGEFSWTRDQAFHSLTFWSLVVIQGLRMLSMSTLNLFRIPYFIESGFSPMLVSYAVSIEAIVSAVVAIPTGWAMDRFQARYVASASLVSFILVFIVTVKAKTTFDVFLAMSLFGVAAASFQVVNNTLWPDYFGSLYIGSIRGVAVPFTTFFGAVGAPVTGWIKDSTGSYIPAWIASTFILVIATALMLFTRKPDPPEEAIIEPS